MDNDSVATIPTPPAVPVLPAPAPVPSTLRVLADEAEGDYTPVRLSNGQDAVILRPGSSGIELVFAPVSDFDVAPRTGVSTLHEDRTATLIVDPAEQAAVLRRAMAVLVADAAAERRTTIELRSRHAETLSEIRDYAVARHLDGEYCRDGLNAFLSHFGMDPYPRRLKVSYTISGFYELDGGDADSAESDGRDYLRVNHDRLDDFVEDSGEYCVSIEGVEEIRS